MPKKQPYYPNNWKAFKDCDESFFLPIDYEEFMDWKVAGWELPSSVNCVIRERNLTTGKVKEYVYQRPMAAQKKLRQRMESGECEFIVANAEAIHLLTPKYEEDYDDPLT